MSIVKRMNENFFEFVWYTNENLARCQQIDIMPYNLFDIKNIDLIDAKPIEDLYKTKLSIKKNVRQLYLGNLSLHDSMVKDMIMFDIGNFEFCCSDCSQR